MLRFLRFLNVHWYFFVFCSSVSETFIWSLDLLDVQNALVFQGRRKGTGIELECPFCALKLLRQLDSEICALLLCARHVSLQFL